MTYRNYMISTKNLHNKREKICRLGVVTVALSQLSPLHSNTDWKVDCTGLVGSQIKGDTESIEMQDMNCHPFKPNKGSFLFDGATLPEKRLKKKDLWHTQNVTMKIHEAAGKLISRIAPSKRKVKSGKFLYKIVTKRNGGHASNAIEFYKKGFLGIKRRVGKFALSDSNRKTEFYAWSVSAKQVFGWLDLLEDPSKVLVFDPKAKTRKGQITVRDTKDSQCYEKGLGRLSFTDLEKIWNDMAGNTQYGVSAKENQFQFVIIKDRDRMSWQAVQSKITPFEFATREFQKLPSRVTTRV